MKKWMTIASGILLVASLAACSDLSVNRTGSSDKASSSQVEKKADTKESKSDRSSKANDTSKASDEDKEALAKAQEYLESLGNYSKEGLKAQLTAPDEGYSEEAAQYAVDHVDADWKEQALKRASAYMEEMNLSKKELEEQLVSELFTKDEASYAADKVDVDWKEKAIGAGKEYRDNLGYTEEEISDSLKKDGYDAAHIKAALKELKEVE